LKLAKPFDATTKRLLELDPVGWLTCAGLPVTGPVRAIDSDLSTVTAEADTIIQVGEPADYLAHIEIQTGHDLTLPRRLLHYNVLLNFRHDRPVRSVVIILRREADSPSFTGRHEVFLPEGTRYLDFRYSVLRIWTLDVEAVLQSGFGTLPLAPLAKVRKKDLPAVIRRMKERFEREVSEPESNLLWTATKILMGMRYSEELVDGLLKGLQKMKESFTYQAILREGRVEGLVEGEQRILLQMARKRLGEPSSAILKKFESIVDESTLSILADRLFEVSTWDEFLSKA
jgi:predicted transposase YdaD